MRSFRHPQWQHLDYRVKVATTQENKPPTQGTRQWTFTTPRWRCGSILLPSLNAGVPYPTGGSDTAKLTGPQTFADKRWVGPVKLLCIIMFNISKIRPKSLLGPVKAQKFLRCLCFQAFSTYFVHLFYNMYESYESIYMEIMIMPRVKTKPILFSNK